MDKKEGLLFRPDGKVKQALDDVTSLQSIIALHQQAFNCLRQLAWKTLDFNHPKLKLFASPHSKEKDNLDIIDAEGTVVYTVVPVEESSKHFKTADLIIDNATGYVDQLKEANTTATEQVKERFGINVADGSYIYNQEGNFIEPNPAYVKPLAQIEAEKAQEKPFLEAVKDPFGEDNKDE